MIKIVDNDIYRGSTKIGYISDNDIFDSRGSKAGYFSDNDIYDSGGRKRGYLIGNEFFLSDGRKIRIDEVRKRVAGGTLSDIERAAIFLLIGD